MQSTLRRSGVAPRDPWINLGADLHLPDVQSVHANAGGLSSRDHQPVHTLFVLLSVTPKQHLELLARLAFLFRHQEFIALLRQRSEPKTIVEWIGNHLPK